LRTQGADAMNQTVGKVLDVLKIAFSVGHFKRLFSDAL
jgi:hypothetical protein